MNFEEKSRTPLYLELETELPVIKILCPRGLDADSGILFVIVYLDGRASVRQQIPLADRLRTL